MQRMTGQRLWLSVLLLGCSLLLQGCLAAAWVAAVGVGSSVNGDVEFAPFENSWVAPPDTGGSWERMDSLAIPPFAGDEAMATRFSLALRDVTTLRVMGPEDLAAHPELNAQWPGRPTIDDAKRANLARAIASRARVDCVLFGTVVKGRVRTDAWGHKEVSSHRLLLTLLDARGRTLWRDELPYRVTEGSRPFPEEWFQDSLTTHVAAHARTIGLPGMSRSADEERPPLHTRLAPSGSF